jgi:hypothetical protein
MEMVLEVMDRVHKAGPWVHNQPVEPGHWIYSAWAGFYFVNPYLIF